MYPPTRQPEPAPHAGLVAGTRSASIPSPSGSAPHPHVVQFYEDEAFLCESVARFLDEGLTAGEPVVVIASDRNSRELIRHLGAAGREIASTLRSGQLTLLDANETLSAIMADGVPVAAAFDAVVGGAIRQASAARPGVTVRAYGDMVDLLSGEGSGAIRLEELWNELGRRHPISLRCAYAMGDFHDASHAGRLRQICDAHTHVIPTEDYCRADDDEARYREIALLQQRAHALQSEVDHRRQVESALRVALADLRQSQEALRESDRRKDEFLAMLAHELRNPLAPILTGLQLLRFRKVGCDDERDMMERQVRHLVRLVDDLLDVSRITRGTVQLNRQPVEIAAALASAIAMSGPLCQQRTHTVSVEAAEAGLLVYADEVRLAQVFANLLTNAAKYTEIGGHISVSARRQAGEIVVSFRDDGIGIAPEMLGNVFDLFVQGQRALDRAQGGLGVGLTVARTLIELHGGTVTATSPGAGLGSEFVVRLPAVELARHQQAAPGASHVRRPGARTQLRILLVDDNTDAAEVLAEALRACGHDVAVAQDGPQALAIAEGFCPDAALLDIGLPTMDGYDLARRLRALLQPRSPRLIALTGYGQEGDRARSREAGFEIHLVKPVDLDSVITIFAQVAEGDRTLQGAGRSM